MRTARAVRVRLWPYANDPGHMRTRPGPYAWGGLGGLCPPPVKEILNQRLGLKLCFEIQVQVQVQEASSHYT